MASPRSAPRLYHTPAIHARSWWRSMVGFLSGSKALYAICTAFLVTRVMICAVIYLSALIFSSNPAFKSTPPAFPHNLVLDGLIRWDGSWYWNIATHGYGKPPHGARVPSTAAFFPVYPLFVKIVSVLTHNAYVAGLLVSNVAFFIALCYLYALVKREFDEETAGRAVFYIAAAPAAVIFTAMYTEGLFVALVTATFYHARQKQWVRAALAGALAAGTRNTGVLLAAVVALEGMSQQGVRFRPPAWKPRVVMEHLRRQAQLAIRDGRSWLAAAFVPVGLLSYMAYLGIAYGDVLGFVHAESSWSSITNSALTRISGTLHNDVGSSGHLLSGTGMHTGFFMFDVLALLVGIPLVIAVAVEMRPAYGVFTVLTFALPPIVGHGVVSLLRFTLMLVPCFIILAHWGRRPWVDRLIIGVSLPLMAYLAITFSHWYSLPSI